MKIGKRNIHTHLIKSTLNPFFTSLCRDMFITSENLDSLSLITEILVTKWGQDPSKQLFNPARTANEMARRATALPSCQAFLAFEQKAAHGLEFGLCLHETLLDVCVSSFNTPPSSGRQSLMIPEKFLLISFHSKFEPLRLKPPLLFLSSIIRCAASARGVPQQRLRAKPLAGFIWVDFTTPGIGPHVPIRPPSYASGAVWTPWRPLGCTCPRGDQIVASFPAVECFSKSGRQDRRHIHGGRDERHPLCCLRCSCLRAFLGSSWCRAGCCWISLLFFFQVLESSSEVQGLLCFFFFISIFFFCSPSFRKLHPILRWYPVVRHLVRCSIHRDDGVPFLSRLLGRHLVHRDWRSHWNLLR